MSAIPHSTGLRENMSSTPVEYRQKKIAHSYKGVDTNHCHFDFLVPTHSFRKDTQGPTSPLPHLFLGVLWLWLLLEVSRLFSAGGSRAHNRLPGCSPCV